MAYENDFYDNGHKYVDLGLPSGTLWATMNVGASKPSDSGLYFQWGDTKGYTKEQVGIEEGKKAFTWEDYKWYLSGSYAEGNLKFKKYTTPGAKLDFEDDAANANMGGDWHMPTPEQFKELIDNTTSERTEQDGVEGMTFTSKKDSSKSIFIPASGSVWVGNTHISEHYGYVFSNMLNTSEVHRGQYFCFTPKEVYVCSGDGRCIGLPVRGVIG